MKDGCWLNDEAINFYMHLLQVGLTRMRGCMLDSCCANPLQKRTMPRMCPGKRQTPPPHNPRLPERAPHTLLQLVLLHQVN